MKKTVVVLICCLMIAGCAGAAGSLEGGKASPIDRPVTNVAECRTVPAIDGKADDASWEAAEWQPIDQVWIPWGGSVPASDFQGRFKLCWSSETDRLYLLVEITDDILVDGYAFPQDAYHNWDVVEIFIDEDASGGDHTLNQNAFAYHITAGNGEKEFEAMDLAADWKKMNYSSHLDCVIEESKDNKYIWEIALKVYDDSFNTRKADNRTVQLEAGKTIGLSVAYCDNDDKDEKPKERDNFFGSVPVPKANFNDHWQNADWFGRIKLVSAQ